MDKDPTMPEPQPQSPKTTLRKPWHGLGRDAMVAAICGFVVVLMVGASYAAVPFYNWFCRATGFNGTTQVATSAPSAAPLSRKIKVRFDSNVAPGLPWKFEPEQTEIELSIGYALQELGYKILNDIAWEKPNPPPNLSCRYFTHSTETILWAAK